MRSPFVPLQLLLFLVILGLLVAFVQVGILRIAFDKLGLSASSAFVMLFASLFGSAINLPLFTIKAERPEELKMPFLLPRLLRYPMETFTGKTLIAVNVGGCLVPLTFSVYLLTHTAITMWQAALAVTVVTLVSRLVSRPVPGMGIGMPIFVAPVTAALAAIIINPEHSAPLAYVGGTLGVLIGADILRLGDIRKLGASFASVGGAGTFDGIFLTGLVAVLLA